MLHKKILAASIAAVFANSAVAAVDLDASPIVPAIYASETVASSDITDDGNRVLVSAGNLDVISNVDAVLQAGTYFVRYDIANGGFSSALLDDTDLVLQDNLGAPIALAGPTVTPGSQVVRGGDEDDSFVIFEVVLAADTARNDQFVFSPADIALSGPGVDASITVSIYDNLGDAANQDNPAVEVSGAYVDQRNGLDIFLQPTNTFAVTADVATDFTSFTNGGAGRIIGTFFWRVNASRSAEDGSIVTREDLFNDSQTEIEIEGNLDYLDSDGINLNTSGTCATSGIVEELDVSASGAELRNTSSLNLSTTYNICVVPDGSTQIEESDPYEITVDFDEGDNGTVEEANAALNRIVRNGTRLDFPFVTNFEGYNQRFIIVNNGSLDADYRCTFTSEEGVTATPGDDAEGTVAAGEKVVIPVRNFVSIEGGTRTSARCDVDGLSTFIDGAATQVNLSDGSTDTYVVN